MKLPLSLSSGAERSQWAQHWVFLSAAGQAAGPAEQQAAIAAFNAEQWPLGRRGQRGKRRARSIIRLNPETVLVLLSANL